jgi:RNase H-like domain found in reverse transcriptase
MRNFLGFLPETHSSHHLLPGVSPGKNTPIILDYVRDRENIVIPDTLDPTQNMTQKIKNLENSIIHVKPIFFHSKLFTKGQRIRYSALEKEFLAMLNSILFFRDYIEAAPICHVLTDSQALLWAIGHKNDQLKLTRNLLKLNELNLNIIFSHVAGSKNVVADFLSCVCYVPDPDDDPDPDEYHCPVKPKEAQHVVSSLPEMTPLEVEDVINAFNGSCIQKCFDPENCPLNINGNLYRSIGPFEYKPTPKCMAGGKGEEPVPEINATPGETPPAQNTPVPPVTKKVNINSTMQSFGLEHKEL